MIRFRCALAATLLLALMAAPASAQTSEENRRRCADASPDLRIAACTAVIETGGETNAGLAIAFANRAMAWVSSGQHRRAIPDYDQAIRLDPSNADVFNGRCYTGAIIGQLEQALKDCEESLRLRPNDAATLDSRGFVHLKAGRHDAAIADYGAALRIEARISSALYGRGLARQRRGDEAGGAVDIIAAKLLQPDIAEEMARYGVQ